MKQIAKPDFNQTSWLRRIFSTAKPVVEKQDTAEAPRPAKPARNQTVLLVDDDPLYLKLAANDLQTEGFDVVTAEDGCAAIQAVREKCPDVMVLDVNLPQDVAGVPWDGFRVMAWLDRMKTDKAMKVVLASSGDTTVFTRRSVEAGATCYFRKKLGSAHLPAVVNESLKCQSPSGNPKADAQQCAEDIQI